MRFLVTALVLAASCSSAPPASEPVIAAPLVIAAPDAAPSPVAPAPAPGCMRQRQTFQYRCSGVPPGPGEANAWPVLTCDQCLADGDCSAQPGGRCVSVGDNMCGPIEHLACKYP